MEAVQFIQTSPTSRNNCLYVPSRRAVYFLRGDKITSVLKWKYMKGVTDVFTEDYLKFGRNAIKELERGKDSYDFGEITISGIKRKTITDSRLEELIKAEQKAKEEQGKRDQRRLV